MESHRRPYVVINAASTIDGKIATKSGDSHLSSKQDIARVHRLRADFDAILVGIGTILADDPHLTVRYASGPNPIRIILDPAGRIPVSSNIISTCGSVPTIVVVTGRANARAQDMLAKSGAKILTVDGDRIHIGTLLSRLYSMGVSRLLVEGGGQTIWEFIAEGVFDEISLTISPHVAGGMGTDLVAGDGFSGVCDGPVLRLLSVQRQGDEVVLRYIQQELQPNV